MKKIKFFFLLLHVCIKGIGTNLKAFYEKRAVYRKESFFRAFRKNFSGFFYKIKAHLSFLAKFFEKNKGHNIPWKDVGGNGQITEAEQAQKAWQKACPRPCTCRHPHEVKKNYIIYCIYIIIYLNENIQRTFPYSLGGKSFNL